MRGRQRGSPSNLPERTIFVRQMLPGRTVSRSEQEGLAKLSPRTVLTLLLVC